DHRAVLFGLFDRFEDQLWRGVTQRGEDAAGVQPPDADLAENMVPIEITGLELAGRRVAAVGNTHCTPDTKTTLGKIQTVAGDPTNPIERQPLDEFSADSALQYKILDQPADLVVGECRAHGGFQAEAPAQAAGDVVFAASLPNLEFAGATDAALTRIQSEHDFAEREQVILAL